MDMTLQDYLKQMRLATVLNDQITINYLLTNYLISDTKAYYYGGGYAQSDQQVRAA